MGLGNIFANPWSVLIVVKHILILAFLALAVVPERAYLNKIGDKNPEALEKFNRTLKLNILLGGLILLLTSIAQAS